ncbi:hypothetical protein GIB67_007560 [Kingdonia uniflora]|uniref:Starch synthase catalytic domain-containing protein n=1 Tax=Kingdonia uniflora TaxID=39325 RepID=A0A7J7LNG6_9MAGN|nr:hypothetical protein GIB67_007560 [Kingdonia uniflora]
MRTAKKGGLYEVSEGTAIKAQLDILTRKIEAMATNQSKGSVNQVQQQGCTVCYDVTHVTQMFPMFNEMNDNQGQVDALNNTYKRPFDPYKPTWQNHPNFSRKNNQPSSGFGEPQTSGTLPSQPVSNPKGPPGFDSSSIPKLVHAITTLRSGREIDNQVEMPRVEPTPVTIVDENYAAILSAQFSRGECNNHAFILPSSTSDSDITERPTFTPVMLIGLAEVTKLSEVMERENLDESLKLTKTIDWITGDETAAINNKVIVKVRYSLTETESVGEEVEQIDIETPNLCQKDHTEHICVPHDANLAIEYHPATSADAEKKFDEESIHLCDHTSELDQLRQEIEEFKDLSAKQLSKTTNLEKKLADSEAHVQQLINRVMLYESKLNSSMTCVDELVYILGGYDGSTWLSSLESYSPSKETVRSHMPMRCIRAYASTTVFNGDIYIFGGGNGVDLDVWYDSEVESYNPLSNKWSVLPPLIERKGSLAGAVLHDKIYAVGGRNGDAYTTNPSGSGKDHVSAIGLHWYHKAIVSVTEAGGLTWLVGLEMQGGTTNSGVVKKTRTRERAVRVIPTSEANAELQVNLNANIDGWIEVSGKNKSTEKELVDLSSRHGYWAYELVVFVVQMKNTFSRLHCCWLCSLWAEEGPWSKTGGLGDVHGGLPLTLAANGNRVMMDSPCYNQYKDVWNTIVSVEIKVGDKIETVQFFHYYKRGVDRVFVDQPIFHEKIWVKTASKVHGLRLERITRITNFDLACCASLRSSKGFESQQ